MNKAEIQTFSLPQRPWYGDTTLQIELPTTWDAAFLTMPGHAKPKAAREDVEAAFANPIGTPRISDLAEGRREVAILFDDLSRPTRSCELMPYVLRELREAGIQDKAVRFVAATGAHRAMSVMEFEKKLGRKVVQRFPVYNHNPYENCTYLGDTSRGTPVRLNSEVMSCDLKIAVGCIVPHPTAGFGGGAKIMVGISHVDTIYANHHDVGGRSGPTPDNPMGSLHPSVGLGKVEGNVMRADLEEMGRMAGIDCIVNVVVNTKRESVGVFVGDLIAAHREGAKMAQEVYRTKSKGGFDIVVLNAFSKANEAGIALNATQKLLKAQGGDAVIVCNTPEGQICHYMSRSFGTERGGRLWGPRTTLPPGVKRMITVGPNIDPASLDWLGPAGQVIRVKQWPAALKILQGTHGPGAKIAIIPDATIQYFT